jgi:cation transport ATPase
VKQIAAADCQNGNPAGIPALPGRVLAAAAMVVSSLTVLGNSLRLRRFPAEPKAGAS